MLKASKSKVAAYYSPFGIRMTEAINSFKESGESSRQVIHKYTVQIYKITAGNKIAGAQHNLTLKTDVTKGELKQSKEKLNIDCCLIL